MTVTEVAVGVDIGTSYTKAAARTEDGTVVAISRVRSPQFGIACSTVLTAVAQWWACLKGVVRDLSTACAPSQLHITSLCVSGIAPTLTAFDAAHADRACAILYSSRAGLENRSSMPQHDLELTGRRLVVLSSIAHQKHFASPCVTDLIGYINWRLTGNVTINSVSLAAMGILSRASFCDTFARTGFIVPQLVTPSEKIGVTTASSSEELGIEVGIPVCGGCPDTMGTVVGAGLSQASETMLYLGTFGSLMCLQVDVDTLLNVAECPRPPFHWVLSVPGLGPEVELLSRQWFGSLRSVERLQMFDREAMKAPPGASGTLFLVPRWKNGMTTVGGYEFVAARSGEIGNIPRQSRSVLESIAYAILALETHMGEVIVASGGGTRSRTWLDIISIVLNRQVRVSHMTWEATGTADIAAGLVWSPAVRAIRPCYISDKYRGVPRAAIEDNSQRVKECYRDHDWI